MMEKILSQIRRSKFDDGVAIDLLGLVKLSTIKNNIEHNNQERYCRDSEILCDK